MARKEAAKPKTKKKVQGKEKPNEETLQVTVPKMMEDRKFRNIPEDLVPYVTKEPYKWKYAATTVRETRALNLAASYIDRDRKNTLTSPAAAYPERQIVMPREKIKPQKE